MYVSSVLRIHLAHSPPYLPTSLPTDAHRTTSQRAGRRADDDDDDDANDDELAPSSMNRTSGAAGTNLISPYLTQVHTYIHTHPYIHTSVHSSIHPSHTYLPTYLHTQGIRDMFRFGSPNRKEKAGGPGDKNNDNNKLSPNRARAASSAQVGR